MTLLNWNLPLSSVVTRIRSPAGLICLATTVMSAIGFPFPSIALPRSVDVPFHEKKARPQRRAMSNSRMRRFTDDLLSGYVAVG